MHLLEDSPLTAPLPAVVPELGRLFADAGHELSLVGGPVRDLFLGRSSPDLDFTTDADPDQIIAVIRRWSDAGALPGYRTPGGQRRFSREQIDAFLDSLEQGDPGRRASL